MKDRRDDPAVLVSDKNVAYSVGNRFQKSKSVAYINPDGEGIQHENFKWKMAGRVEKLIK